jgi:predicted nucleic acid-binding protein
MQKRSQVNIVLDAWALLALIFKEQPAATSVRDVLKPKGATQSSAHMSWINLGEVYYSIAHRKGLSVADETLDDIKMLPIRLHEPSKSDILAAAAIKSQHKLSYADAFAVSLAQRIEGVIFTGDPEIILLRDIVRVEKLSRLGPGDKGSAER